MLLISRRCLAIGRVVSEWGANPGSPADLVTSATFLPPPDGLVDAADLAVLLGNWGPCTEAMNGPQGDGASDDGGIGTDDVETLLQILLFTNSSELAEYIATLLDEWSQ